MRRSFPFLSFSFLFLSLVFLRNIRRYASSQFSSIKSYCKVSIEIDNATSPIHTIFRCVCPDRKGILYDFFRLLSDVSCNSSYGRIATSNNTCEALIFVKDRCVKEKERERKRRRGLPGLGGGVTIPLHAHASRTHPMVPPLLTSAHTLPLLSLLFHPLPPQPHRILFLFSLHARTHAPLPFPFPPPFPAFPSSPFPLAPSSLSRRWTGGQIKDAKLLSKLENLLYTAIARPFELFLTPSLRGPPPSSSPSLSPSLSSSLSHGGRGCMELKVVAPVDTFGGGRPRVMYVKAKERAHARLPSLPLPSPSFRLLTHVHHCAPFLSLPLLPFLSFPSSPSLPLLSFPLLPFLSSLSFVTGTTSPPHSPRSG